MQVVVEILRTLVAPAAQVLLALAVAYLVTLWVTLIIWTFRDIETRSRSVITQIFATLLVVFFFLPGAILYLILRPKETLDEAFQRALQEEYLLQDLEELPLCPSCRHYVQSDFVLCPYCHARLRENCPSCERLVELRWSVCPYCTAALPVPDESEAAAEAEAPLKPVRLPEWVSPALRRLRARMLSLRARELGGPTRRPWAMDDTAPTSTDAGMDGISGGERTRRVGEGAVAEAARAARGPGNGYHEPEAAVLEVREPQARLRGRARMRALTETPPAGPDGAAPLVDGAPVEEEIVAPKAAGTVRTPRE